MRCDGLTQGVIVAERNKAAPLKMCEELPPFGECGFGTCVNGSCVCDGGFSQNFEFYYKDLPPSGVITFCDYNSAAMTTVTSVLLLLTVFSFGIELIILKTWKQVCDEDHKRSVEYLGNSMTGEALAAHVDWICLIGYGTRLANQSGRQQPLRLRRSIQLDSHMCYVPSEPAANHILK